MPTVYVGVKGTHTVKQKEIAVQRSAGDGTLDEITIRGILADEGLDGYHWANGPGDVYGTHTHSYHKVIYVLIFRGLL